MLKSCFDRSSRRTFVNDTRKIKKSESGMYLREVLWLLTVMSIITKGYSDQRHPGVSAAEESPTFWMESGLQDVLDAVRLQQNTHVARNVIIFVGDGMGISTVTAARFLQGQKEGRAGEDSQLSFEKFPYVALSKTYSVSHQVPDSAATATALFTGVKTNTATLGVSARAKVGDCDSLFGNEVTSILQWAQESGKDTGLVTNTRVTHATPAALYAHTPQRDWETDAKMLSNATRRCKDIARQMVEDFPGRDLKVILGGGRIHFMPSDMKDATADKNGSRVDKLDLIDFWKNEKANRNARAKYVTNAEELSSVAKGSVDYLLGLFNYQHMDFEVDRNKSPKGEPSLAAMTKAAISVLQKNNKGFFLMVEGGRIDHAHHNNNAYRALSETLAFSEAVQVALDTTSKKDTLIVVTADHSHVMTVNGYPKRGNPILGVAGVSERDTMPYTTLMYTNGPSDPRLPLNISSNNSSKRRNLTGVNTESVNFFQDVTVMLKDETHGGEDVPIYTSGPMAHMFHGVVEQNFVAHAMAYASCIGRNKDHCRRIGERLPRTATEGSSAPRVTHNVLLMFALFISMLIMDRLRN